MDGGADKPGCRVESTIFFAFHNSGFISLTFPCLYAVTRFFALSSPALLTSNVLDARQHEEDRFKTTQLESIHLFVA